MIKILLDETISSSFTPKWPSEINYIRYFLYHDLLKINSPRKISGREGNWKRLVEGLALELIN